MAKRKSGPPVEKPKTLTIHAVKRTRRFIFIDYAMGDEVMTVRSNDNPLPAFTVALDDLAPLVGVILHLPEEYSHAVNGMKIVGAHVSTQGGARLVSVVAQKSLDDASKAFKIVTPGRLLEHPTEEGTYTPPLGTDWIGVVEELIEQAKCYVKGERAQGQLPLEGDAEGDDDSTGDDLPGIAPDNGGVGKPAKQKPAKN